MSGFFGALAEGAAAGSALASGQGILAALGFGDFAALAYPSRCSARPSGSSGNGARTTRSSRS